MVNSYRPPQPGLQMAQRPWWTDQGNQAQPYTPPAPTTNWGQVPSISEAMGGGVRLGNEGRPWFYSKSGGGTGDLARTANPDPHGNLPGSPGYMSPDTSTTTSIPGGPGVGVGALAPVVQGQAKTGTGQSGQEQVANAPIQEMNTPGGQDASWAEIARGMIRNGWGLDPVGARQNNGIIVGYGSPYQKTIIMPTDYNYAADTARWYVAGAGNETAMQRALRKTADEMAFKPNLNSMQVLAKWMRFVDQEARQQGKSSGFNMAQMGGQGMDPNTAGAPTSATPGAPGAPPPAGQPGAPPPGTPPVDTQQPAGGRGHFREDQIAAAMQDSDEAYRMYREYTTGTTRAGSGPFSRYFDQWFEPVVMAAINAASAGGKKLTSADVEALFTSLASQVKAGNLTQNTGGMAQNFMNSVTGGTIGEDYDLLRNSASAMSPLMSLGLSPIWRSGFLRDQQNTFADMYDRAQSDPNFGEGITDWGRRFAESPFFKQWYLR